jgi:hypothetical protein
VFVSGERLKKLLSNPMVLLIVGALISSLIIPYYTRQWQDRQKELELKTNLADEINRAVSDMIVSATYRSKNSDPILTNKNWLISDAMISSKIKAYFSNIPMNQDWNNLSSVVSQLTWIGSGLPKKNDPSYNLYYCQLLASILNIHEYYRQSGPLNIDRSEVLSHNCNTLYYPGLENIQYINKSFPARNGDVDWNALLHVDDPTVRGLREYDKTFEILRKHIEDHTNEFLDTLLKSRTTIFG